MTSASGRIAAFAADFNSRPLSAAQRHLAYRAFLDTYASAIAGRNEEAVHLATRYVSELAGTGQATSWIGGETLPAESAAWLNGVAAHVLDYDDVMTPMRAHVSTTLVPALAALGQSTGATGRQYAAAYAAGFEVMAKFARAMALPHYTKGWHSTSALGILGTTVACGVLLGLSAQQHSHALGIAVAQAAGTRENFGSMTKSFQAGQCAAASVRAALLAQIGFTASPDAIDGKYGFMSLYAARENLEPTLATLGADPLEIDAIGIDVKKYPCCYAMHRALDGAFALMKAHDVRAEHISSVHILTSAGGMQALIAELPKDGLESKFSMQYGIACALVDGRIQLSSFTDAAVRRPEIQSLMSRIDLVESPGDILPRWSEITLMLKDGRSLTQRVLTARGDAGDPLSDEELIRKAEDCFAYGGYGRDARAFASRIFELDDNPIGTLSTISTTNSTRNEHDHTST
jgi:2-methylcitrate dehydratase PrpD